MGMQLQLTNNFISDFDNLIGRIEFATEESPRASFIYEMIKLKPSSFVIMPAYEKTDDGERLINFSVVNNHRNIQATDDQIDNVDLFENSFHNWLEENGCYLGSLDEESGAWSAHVDLNKLKLGFMKLVDAQKAVNE